jgi:RNA polymerase sigma factor (sigma-70 family)
MSSCPCSRLNWCGELRGVAHRTILEGSVVTSAQLIAEWLEDSDEVAAAQLGDEVAFTGFAESYRRELQVYGYRMLGSFEASEDLVEETFVRAWRGRESFEGGMPFGAWLHGIATHACLDVLARRPKTDQMAWRPSYPDELLEPADLAAIQQLPPRQRAVFILRDVLGWNAGEIASVLESSVAAVYGALQRARSMMSASDVGNQLGEERPDAAVDVVADDPDLVDGLSGGIGQHPVLVAFAREDRAGVTAAHRDHDI